MFYFSFQLFILIIYNFLHKNYFDIKVQNLNIFNCLSLLKYVIKFIINLVFHLSNFFFFNQKFTSNLLLC